jgi:Flp pilus assembly pilin Flp
MVVLKLMEGRKLRRAPKVGRDEDEAVDIFYGLLAGTLGIVCVAVTSQEANELLEPCVSICSSISDSKLGSESVPLGR